MIVGARQGVLSIFETGMNGMKNEKHPVGSSSASWNVLLMQKVRGEGPDWFKLIGR